MLLRQPSTYLAVPPNYIDVFWNSTDSTYDSLGRAVTRSGPLGNETQVYDSFSRLTEKKLDGVTYAVITYDEYSRMKKVDYPTAGGQRLEVAHDQLGRLDSRTYYTNTQAGIANLVANPSAEQTSSNPSEPQGWHTNSWGTNTASFSYINEGYSGGRSVRAKVTSYASGDAKWYFDPVSVSGGAGYTFSDHYRSDTTTQVVVQYTHQNSSLTYEWLGSLPAASNWTQANLPMTAPATATHATVYHLISSVGQLDIDDAKLIQGNQPSGQGSATISDTVARTQSGRVNTDTVNTDGSQLTSTYGYDAAGRLSSANIGADAFTYGFGALDSSCGGGNNINPNAGKNSNRVSQTINGLPTTFCYDYADRLVSSSNPSYSSAQYDSHGNMTRLGTTSGGATETQFSYDSSDRLRQLTENTTGQPTKAVFYSMDVTGRLKSRDHQVNWQSQGMRHFGYTSPSGSPDIIRDNSWNIVEKYLQLPGGVLLTIRPQQSSPQDKTYSFSNVHGDVFATANANGIRTGTYRTGPFGEPLSGQQTPNNTHPGATNSYLGQHQKLQEQTFLLNPTVMGARTYLPSLGRFTQVDPIEGGTLNSYVYAVDPVNFSDLSGTCILQCTAKASYVQPAARITQVQPTAPARRVQGAGSARSSTGRAGAPKQSPAKRSSAPPPALKAIDFSKLNPNAMYAARPGYLSGGSGGGQSSWTLSIGGNIGFGLEAGGGVATGSGGTYYYNAIGIGWEPGVGLSATISPFATRSGCQVSLSAFGFMGFLGGSISKDGWAIGVGIPSISLTRTCI